MGEGGGEMWEGEVGRWDWRVYNLQISIPDALIVVSWKEQVVRRLGVPSGDPKGAHRERMK